MTNAQPNTLVSGSGIAMPWFLGYKFCNSLFLGLSIGSVFILYTPLSPAVFSAGGIGLAIATLLIATQYHRLFQLQWFFRLSLAVEVIVLAGILGVLMYPLALPLALFIYLGYQITFAFGSYLVRCETLLITDNRRLAQLDVAKQCGYLGGMALAWGFYAILEQCWDITLKTEQVVLMHWPLLIVEVATIALLISAFCMPETLRTIAPHGDL